MNTAVCKIAFMVQSREYIVIVATPNAFFISFFVKKNKQDKWPGITFFFK